MRKLQIYFCVLCCVLGSTNFVKAQDLSELIEEKIIDNKRSFSAATPTPDEIYDISLEEDSIGMEMEDSTDVFDALKPIQQFYLLRDYQAVWYSEEGLLSKADTFLNLLNNATVEGLEPEDYNYTTLQEQYDDIDRLAVEMFMADAEQLADIDIALSRAALKYAGDLRLGKVDPVAAKLQWEIAGDEVEIPFEMQAIDSLGVTQFFEGLLPQNEHYTLLKSALAQFDSLAQQDTAFTALIVKQKLEYGDSSEQVGLLRDRLKAFYEMPDPETNKIQYVQVPTITELDTINVIDTSKQRMTEYEVCKDTIYAGTDSMYVVKDSAEYAYDTLVIGPKTLVIQRDSFSITADTVWDPYYFDSTLLKSLVRFQKQYGLEPDSVVGPKTIGMLNRPISDHIETIKLNLDRWRWLPRENSNKYLIVNVAGFYVDVFQADTVFLRKQVMVGNVRTKTPIFGDMIQYLEINPYWTVPYSIASREMLPKLKKDPSYLARNNYRLFKGGKSVDPYSIDWSTVKRSGFPYKIRQNPGKNNALGMVKFMFPNRYNVYLHDTPSKHLFVKYSRAFSHGCIRLENPFELAEYLLQEDPKWTAQKIEQTLNRGKNKRIDLKTPVPVFIAYFTTWVDEKGDLRFQKDIYKRDVALRRVW